MSMERELGQLTEAVSGLKRGQDETRDAVRDVATKLDRHLELQARADAAMNFKVGRLAGTIALTVSIILAGAKEALARIFHP